MPHHEIASLLRSSQGQGKQTPQNNFAKCSLLFWEQAGDDTFHWLLCCVFVLQLLEEASPVTGVTYWPRRLSLYEKGIAIAVLGDGS